MDENGFNQFNGQGNSAPQEQPRTAEPQPNMQQNVKEQQGTPPMHEPPKPKKKKGTWKIIVSVTAGIVAGILLTVFVIAPIAAGQFAAMPKLPTKEEQQQDGTGEKPQLGGDAQDVANAAEPAVQIAENISGSVVGVATYDKQLVSGEEPIERMLTAGTGFVISEKDGYIITNNHVVAMGNLIRVTAADGKEYPAEKIGGDSASDIAVLKVNDIGIKAVPIGDSDNVKAGGLAVAIGNVHGEAFSNSVTVGHISIAKHSVTLEGNKSDMIQMDAAINPGNSGGPLIGADGKVIGVTTAKKFYSGIDETGNLIATEGVGYAIPINRVIGIAEQLIENGSIPRAGMGISYTLISDVDAKLWGTPRGALVAEVTPGGPADAAGIMQNDVITELAGEDLTTGANLPVLAEKAVGEVITAKVWREGQVYSVEITLADMNNIG
ncbi:MAG: trypsin-like peptidase domain-containing protein [Christensenella sp.]